MAAPRQMQPDKLIRGINLAPQKITSDQFVGPQLPRIHHPMLSKILESKVKMLAVLLYGFYINVPSIVTTTDWYVL